MSKPLHAWEYGDPAEVAERRQLQAIAAASRETEKLMRELEKRTVQERIRAKVFRKARPA